MTHFCFAKINIGTPFTIPLHILLLFLQRCTGVTIGQTSLPPSFSVLGLLSDKPSIPSSSSSACLHQHRAGQPVYFGCLIISLNVWVPRRFIEQEKWDVLQLSSLLKRASYSSFLSGVTIGQRKKTRKLKPFLMKRELSNRELHWVVNAPALSVKFSLQGQIKGGRINEQISTLIRPTPKMKSGKKN